MKMRHQDTLTLEIPPRAPVSQSGMFPLTSCGRSLACVCGSFLQSGGPDDITAAETRLPRPAYENSIRSICGRGGLTDAASTDRWIDGPEELWSGRELPDTVDLLIRR